MNLRIIGVLVVIGLLVLQGYLLTYWVGHITDTVAAKTAIYIEKQNEQNSR